MIGVIRALLNTIARYFKKPKILEGDINFLELEHPEFQFVRIPPEDEHGAPCMYSYSPLGEIYVCARVDDRRRYGELNIKADVFVCSEFEFGDNKGKYCSEVCLEPEDEEYYGVVVDTSGKRVIEMTPFAAEAHSKIVAIKEFLTKEEFEKTVGRNIINAFNDNLWFFIWGYDLCEEENVEETNKFLKALWEMLEKALGKEKLAKVVNSHILTSCKSFDYKMMPGHDPTSRWFTNYQRYQKLRSWDPKYDTQEFVEEYVETLRTISEVKKNPHVKVSIYDLYFLEDIYSNEKYSKILSRIENKFKPRLKKLSCRELAKEIPFMKEEVCEELERLEKLVSELKNRSPLTEEDISMLTKYTTQIDQIKEFINEDINTYSRRQAINYMEEHYNHATYEELQKLAEKGDRIARELMDIIEDYCVNELEECIRISLRNEFSKRKK